MSAAEKKKFVMKHVFTDLMNMKKGKMYYGKEENHCNVSWALAISEDGDNDISQDLNIYLKCEKLSKNCWSIETEFELKLFKNDTEESEVLCHTFKSEDKGSPLLKFLNSTDVKDYLVDGSLTIECFVKITKMIGIREKLRNFDDTLAKELSDVVIVVDGEKFYLSKICLALHSTYFKSLLFGNVNESIKSEVELKNVSKSDFQNYLEVLHGELAVDENTFEGILHLSDMFDSKTPIRHCEKFLLEHSMLPLNTKFEIAVKHKMVKLKEKCISEMKTLKEVWSVVPDDIDTFDKSVYVELLRKACSL